jgi:hypothetical protein
VLQNLSQLGSLVEDTHAGPSLTPSTPDCMNPGIQSPGIFNPCYIPSVNYTGTFIQVKNVYIQSNFSCAGTGDGKNVLCVQPSTTQNAQNTLSVTTISSVTAPIITTNSIPQSPLPSPMVNQSPAYSTEPTAFFDANPDGTTVTRVWSCGGGEYYNQPMYIGDTIYNWTQSPAGSGPYSNPMLQLGWNSGYETLVGKGNVTVSVACASSVVRAFDGTYRMFFECSVGNFVTQSNVCAAMSNDGQTWSIWGYVCEPSSCPPQPPNANMVGWVPSSTGIGVPIFATTPLSSTCNVQMYPPPQCPYGAGLPSALVMQTGPVTWEIWIYYYFNANTGPATYPSGSTTINVTSPAGIIAGQTVTGPGIPPNTSVVSVSGNIVTLSQSTTGCSSPPPSTTACGHSVPVAFAAVYRARTYDGIHAFETDATNLTNGSHIYSLDTYRGQFFLATKSDSQAALNPDLPPAGNYALLSADGLHFERETDAHPLPFTNALSRFPSVDANPAIVSDVHGHVALNLATQVTLVSSEDDLCPWSSPTCMGPARPGQTLWPIFGTFPW